MSVEELFMQIQTLARSMGIINDVECNITGVECKSNWIEDDSKSSLNALGSKTEEHNFISTEHCANDRNDIDILLHSESERFRFCLLSESTKQECCNKLGISYSLTGNNRKSIEIPIRQLGKPWMSKEIIADGNCFFRAISYSLTNSENHHYAVRSAICKHIMKI